MEIQKLEIKQDCALIEANNAMLDQSSFVNVSMCNVSISDANLTKLRIDGAQMGDAVFKNIGMPNENHPNYIPDLEHKPISFELCDLKASIFKNCDLRDVRIEDCNITGLTINGISISDIIEAKQ